MRTDRWLFVACLLSVAALGPSAHAEGQIDARQQQLDRLFKALRAAPNEDTAAMLESRIRKLWLEQASPAAALLMARGERDLHNDAPAEAIDDFSAVLQLEPDFAEGYTQRAIARAAAGDYAGSVSDIEEALRRDPRHFAALQALSHIAEEHGDWRGALEAWRKALDIDPRTPGGIERLEMLQKKVEGEAT